MNFTDCMEANLHHRCILALDNVVECPLDIAAPGMGIG